MRWHFFYRCFSVAQRSLLYLAILQQRRWRNTIKNIRLFSFEQVIYVHALARTSSLKPFHITPSKLSHYIYYRYINIYICTLRLPSSAAKNLIIFIRHTFYDCKSQGQLSMQFTTPSITFHLSIRFAEPIILPIQTNASNITFYPITALTKTIAGVWSSSFQRPLNSGVLPTKRLRTLEPA